MNAVSVPFVPPLRLYAESLTTDSGADCLTLDREIEPPPSPVVVEPGYVATPACARLSAGRSFSSRYHTLRPMKSNSAVVDSLCCFARVRGLPLYVTPVGTRV